MALRLLDFRQHVVHADGQQRWVHSPQPPTFREARSLIT
jgi:hypothetical protein